MKQQEVFKKIGTIIKELNEQYDYLETTKGQLNDLELELFVANAHFLAEHSEVLRKLNLQNTPAIAPKSEISFGEKYFEPVVQQANPVTGIKPEIEDTLSLPPDTPAKPIEAEITNTNTADMPLPHIDLTANGADDDFSYIRQEPETIRHELILDDTQNWEEEDEGFDNNELTEEPLEKKIYTPPSRIAKTEPAKSVHEEIQVKTYTEEKKEELITINQRISAQLNKTGSKATEDSNIQPVADLKQAINLNDKLLYVKDLFNGYSLAYSEAIEILNRLETFEEADKFLQNSYAVKNNWESKQATVDKFYGLLKRRYL
jgi:hypothetical protein